MNDKLIPKVTFQLYTDEKCFGPGVCRLLELVREYKSLRQAALIMEMAYSKAWKIVKRAEEGLGFKLLDSKIGGKQGGGAELTSEAEKIISAYRAYEKDLNDFSDDCFEKYMKWI